MDHDRDTVLESDANCLIHKTDGYRALRSSIVLKSLRKLASNVLMSWWLNGKISYN